MKPVAYIYFDKGVLKKVTQKEKLQYSELAKVLLDRDLQLAEEDKALTSGKGSWVYNMWRIVYTDGVVESLSTTRLAMNFGKSRVGKITGKEVHHLIREVPKEKNSIDNMMSSLVK